MSSMRINRYLALCGQGSRRSVETLVLSGRVLVDGKEVRELSFQVEDGMEVRVDGKAVRPPHRYTALLLHKPPGFICTAYDPEGRRTVFELLPPGFRTLRYVGRLDFNSRGLLLFTDDGELVHRLTHPSFEVPRTYLVWTEDPLSGADVRRLEQGVVIGDKERALPVEVKVHPRYAEITLREGRNREIRRMMESLGHTVRDLKRISWGPLSIGELPAGEFRELSDEELGDLYALVDMV